MENITINKLDGTFENVEVNIMAEGNDTHDHSSQESVLMVDAENIAIDGLDIIHDSSKTTDTNVEQIESIVNFDVDHNDVLQKKLPVQSVNESKESNTVDNAIDVNGDPSKDSDHTNVGRIWLLMLPILFLIVWISILWLRKIMFMMFVFKKLPSIMEIMSKQNQVFMMKLNKMMYPKKYSKLPK